MTPFKSQMAQELGIFIEGQLDLIRHKQLEAHPMEQSELWGQRKQLQKIKTWLHWYEGKTK